MSRPGEGAGRPLRVLIPEADLQRRVSELGAALARDYAGRRPVLVGVLQGALVFLADLVRATPIDLDVDVLTVSSYETATRPVRAPAMRCDLGTPVGGRPVVLVEDIVDTGRTIRWVREHLAARQPASLRLCALLDKAGRRQVPVPIEYRGFEIPDVFVVGYGLDYAGLYRNLPYLAVLEGDGPEPAAGAARGRML